MRRTVSDIGFSNATPQTRWSLLLCVCLGCVAARADNETGMADNHSFRFSASLDRDQAKIAEPLTVTLTAVVPTGWRIEPPAVPQQFGELHVIDWSDRRQSVEQSTLWIRQLKLESYAAGRWTFPEVVIDLHPSPGDNGTSSQSVKTENARTLKSQPLSVRVRSALPPFEFGTRLRSIDGPVAVPWTWRQWLSAALTAMVTIPIIARLVIAARRRRQMRSMQPPTSLQRWNHLQRRWLEGEIADSNAVAEAAEILRGWLRTTDADPDVHRTTGQWRSRLEQRGDVSQIDVAIDVLATADEARFANHRVDLDDVRRCLDGVRTVIGPAPRTLSAAERTGKNRHPGRLAGGKEAVG